MWGYHWLPHDGFRGLGVLVAVPTLASRKPTTRELYLLHERGQRGKTLSGNQPTDCIAGETFPEFLVILGCDFGIGFLVGDP